MTSRKARYDRTIGTFGDFVDGMDRYHDVGLSVSLHLIAVAPKG